MSEEKLTLRDYVFKTQRKTQTFQGLSREERLKEYAKEPEKHKYKSAINCLSDRDCRECKNRTNCAVIRFRKVSGWTQDSFGNWVKPRIWKKKGLFYFFLSPKSV